MLVMCLKEWLIHVRSTDQIICVQNYLYLTVALR